MKVGTAGDGVRVLLEGFQDKMEKKELQWGSMIVRALRSGARNI